MIEPETAGDAPDTRYDDLIARLRDAAGNDPNYLRDIALGNVDEDWAIESAVLRVAADVIA